jgi:DNA-binding CsgD family transcriptional regulator
MLCGRDAELAALRERLAGNEAVAIVGQAGIGKTTLMREAATRSGRMVFEGGGISTLSWMPYLPFARALGDKPPKGDAAAVAALLAEEVEDGVLIVDDLQWVDPQTRGVIPLVAGRVALLVALRKGDPAAKERLKDLRDIGIVSLEVHPLGTPDAENFVRERRPDLPGDAVRRVVAGAGGNPLLLEQLALGNGSVEMVRLGLGARLRPHSRPAREAAARLALLGHPAKRALLGEGVDDLLEAGLMIERHGRIELRHELLGQAVLEEFEAPELCRFHSELAATLSDPGEAARHHAKAGERELAHAKALAAARQSTHAGERASHLGLAAASASGPAADELRVEAAEALVEAADFRAALGLCQSVDVDRHPALARRAALIRGRAHFQLGELQTAQTDIADGLRHAEGTGTAVEVQLRLEEVYFRLSDWTPALHKEKAMQALELARSVGAQEARAEFVLAMVLLTAEAPGCIEHAKRALTLAKRERDEPLELEAAQCLAGAYLNFGDPRSAYRLYERTADRARRYGLRLRDLEARLHQAHVELYSFGSLARARTRMLEVLREPLALGEWRARTRANLALCEAQAGNHREASRILEAARADARDDNDTRAYLAWACAEANWLAGRPHAVLDGLDACRDGVMPLDSYAAVVEGWAALDVGRPAPCIDRISAELLAGAVPESHALEQLTQGDSLQAEELFLEAADLWAGRVVFEELRCLWGAGVAALKSGTAERAQALLTETEMRASAHGYQPLGARIRRSLRQAGAPSAARRRPARGVLTAREREALELVAAGLTTREIATRLGVAPSTVDSQLKSATRKLGTRTRKQAALAAIGEGN